MTTISTDALLGQLHRALVDSLVLSDRHNLHDPVTVAEIYTDLIPYRSVRTLGFALNADYEHALLQFLAGEGGYALIEPVEVRDQLRNELKSSNPNLGIYRHYAACDVYVAVPEELDLIEELATKRGKTAPVEPAAPAVRPVSRVETAQIEAAMHTQGELEPIAAIREFAARAAQAMSSPPPASVIAPPLPTVAKTGAPPQASRQDAVGAGSASKPETRCMTCDHALPSGRTARFCPFCGVDQTVRKCVNCQEELEDGWKFCIACGATTE
ncbi:MAG: zinc ribbon domain-containing protein [Gemmatimonadota bacterium]